jgi:hypothetical protein
MASRASAARAAAVVLLGLAVSAALVELGRSGGQGAAGPAGGRVADGGRAPAATPGGQAAPSGPAASTPAGTAAASPPGAAGGSGEAAADPCRLVTGAEAAAALRRPVARMQRRQGFLVRSCVFSDAGGGRQLLVQVDQGPAASQTQFRMGRTPRDLRVAGVGDEAWFTPDTGLLDVRQGTARFQVGLLDPAGQTAGARVPRRLLTLARLVAGRV